MIIVKLMGGLGNQMFQYAAARRLALVNKAPLKLDMGWFANIAPGETPRQYELHVFNSVQDVASSQEVKALQGVDIRRWPKVAKRFLSKTGLLMKQSCVRERDNYFDPAILSLLGDIYLDGFWQSAGYFADMAETIHLDFTIIPAQDSANMRLADIIRSVEAVSIHVRRGDYVTDHNTNQFHGICSLDYYRAAVAEMVCRIREPHFFVFSDDHIWVKEHLRFEHPTTFVDCNGPDKGHEDLRLMSLCRHNIIANSSFSWWGAWLNRNPEKIVIAPRKWFNTPNQDIRDLIPANWLTL